MIKLRGFTNSQRNISLNLLLLIYSRYAFYEVIRLQ